MNNIEDVFWIIYISSVPFFLVWAIKEQIRRNWKWRLWELRDYVGHCYKIQCPQCNGTGCESYTLDGEPTGEFCEDCDSYGYMWRAICPPRWLKHGNTWRQSEFEELQRKAGN